MRPSLVLVLILLVALYIALADAQCRKQKCKWKGRWKYPPHRVSKRPKHPKWRPTTKHYVTFKHRTSWKHKTTPKKFFHPMYTASLNGRYTINKRLTTPIIPMYKITKELSTESIDPRYTIITRTFTMPITTPPTTTPSYMLKTLGPFMSTSFAKDLDSFLKPVLDACGGEQRLPFDELLACINKNDIQKIFAANGTASKSVYAMMENTNADQEAAGNDAPVTLSPQFQAVKKINDDLLKQFTVDDFLKIVDKKDIAITLRGINVYNMAQAVYERMVEKGNLTNLVSELMKEGGVQRVFEEFTNMKQTYIIESEESKLGYEAFIKSPAYIEFRTKYDEVQEENKNKILLEMKKKY